MRRLFPLAAALACACAMPELPEGYQLQCYDDSECPAGTSCSQLCCVEPGEAPVCLVRSWRNAAGGPCLDDTQCAQGLRCYAEASAGPVGGLCTQPCDEGCSNSERCVPIPALAAEAAASSDFCMPQCPGFDGQAGCRPGYRCACEGNNCGCVPACNPSGEGSCDPDPSDGSPRGCEPTSGLCGALP